MSFPVKALALVFGVGGVAAAGFGGVYFNSKETIGSKLGDDVLGADDTFKDSWKNQHDKLKRESDNLAKFPELDRIKKNGDSEKAWTELRDWCSNSYTFTYKDMFSKESDDTRLNLTRKYCIQTMKERLTALYSTGGKKVLAVSGEGDKNEFVTNYKKLNTYKKDKLPESLKEIDTSKVNDEVNTNWTKVQVWCSSIHENPFKGENDTFELAKKLCVKES